jgi:hypothetical protein
LLPVRANTLRTAARKSLRLSGFTTQSIAPVAGIGELVCKELPCELIVLHHQNKGTSFRGFVPGVNGLGVPGRLQCRRYGGTAVRRPSSFLTNQELLIL